MVGANRQQPFVGAFRPVFFEDAPRQLQQRHDRFRIGLLPPYANPQRAVLRPFDMSGREASQIGIGQPREGGEEKQVADKTQARRRKRRSHQPMQLLAGEVSLLATRTLRFVFGERVGRDDSRGDGLADDRFQAGHEQNDRRRSQTLLRTQIQIESFDQRPVQSPERQIRQIELRRQKTGQVLKRILVARSGLRGAIDPDMLLEALDKPSEITEQRLLSRRHTQ